MKTLEHLAVIFSILNNTYFNICITHLRRVLVTTMDLKIVFVFT
jgi:hypothetical protein